ncbi:PREDICTED: pentatricopeptide repeat-containing protein At2g17033-like isoform X1 [Camelina sativa]|uniref:Pentatricopeptide repeat-containing protein At2g17033-like isoform X1 n=1 Tax=Camelina sativa TaxID=90675 RepID=A0ABM0XQB2_CAMSA|nr:PREDICTED: pentatricopeptide repeat-containing protein At2g17033-like isoform X1 [Camelina sativa]
MAALIQTVHGGLVVTRTFMSRHIPQNQVISSKNRLFLFTSPQRLSQGICYSGEELSNMSWTYRTKMIVRCKAGAVPLMKQGHRFLSSLSSPSLAGDPSATNRHIKKFVAAFPKSLALNVLSHLLSDHTSHPHLSFFAPQLYSEITEASWFDWNPKLIADLVALLNKQERFQESETLLSTAVSRLESSERDFALFLCNLVESNSKQGSIQGFNEACFRLREIIQRSSSVYVKTQAYKSMVSGLCNMDQYHVAERVIEEMRMDKINPGLFEYESVLYSYGRLGLFDDMNRIVQRMETEGHRIDTVCSNMVLSSYGAHDALPQMGSWLQKLKGCNVPLSIRTYNTVLNSCPTVMSLLKDLDNCPVSLSELLTILNEDEALLVRELTQSSVLDEAIQWNAAVECKLDLHGMHLSASYLIMLQWMDEIRLRFSEEKCVVPAEIVVVSGSGKHSNVRGESPVKALVKKIMVRTSSPMRIDRKNVGSFIAKGKTVKEWLCKMKL